jgi:hypothetical protein
VALTAKSVVRRDGTQVCQEADEPGTPAVQRKSLPADQESSTRKQRQATRKYRVLEADEEEQPVERTTDDLVEEHAPVRSSGKITPTPSRSRRMAQSAPRKVNIVVVAMVIILVIMAVVGIVWFVLFVGDCLADYNNTLTYGPNRTTIVNGVFGHNHDSPTDPTDVIAVNAKGILLIEEVPAGDVSKTKVYPTGLTLVGDNAKKVPFILTVRDLNRDHKPDVLIEIPGQNVTLKLINNGTDFTLVTK